MNERIRELVKQATTIEEHKWGVSYDNFNKEKFAELIVRECAEVADTADATREKWQSIGKFVREHFGVKS